MLPNTWARVRHVNVVGRLRNNNYHDDAGADVYAMAFTCEEIDYLDTRASAQARQVRAQEGEGWGESSMDAHGATTPPQCKQGQCLTQAQAGLMAVGLHKPGQRRTPRPPSSIHGFSQPIWASTHHQGDQHANSVCIGHTIWPQEHGLSQ